ncbi:hypothetical protein [Pseudomonas viridiflava]|uniref:hypothetical protein n=1 Tax=Pseudomonas viridiflava TaxID=33069 RepID=UPI00047434CE|nr:hypothetical protein [Pseudomonas viridiflava]QXG27193.1 hypothetical protein KTT56_10230 [Pseudomonas viridiflava]QXG32902.1 hypothetical protein KTT59_13115 [Pseudomonas viridiflava]
MRISGLASELFKALLAGSIAYAFVRYDFALDTNEIASLGAAVAGCSATILGFLIAAVALMASIMDRTLMANLRATGGYQKLMLDSFICTGLHLILMVSALSLLLPWRSGRGMILIFTVFLAGLAWLKLVTTGAGLYRVIVRVSRA